MRDLRIHVAPVGLDSAERIWKPLVAMRADKAYLISHLKDSMEVQKIVNQVERTLKNRLPACDTELIRTNIWDLFLCLKEFRQIFLSERENHVFVNVSTGSKILAISGMLSCMIWGGTPYYSQLDYAGAHSPRAAKLSVRSIETLPVYSLQRPSEQSLKVISIIDAAHGSIRKKELIKKLQSPEYELIQQYRSDQPTATHSRLRAILEPLEDEWKFVRVEARGRRSVVSLTPQGETALKIFGNNGVLNSRTAN